MDSRRRELPAHSPAATRPRSGQRRARRLPDRDHRHANATYAGDKGGHNHTALRDTTRRYPGGLFDVDATLIDAKTAHLGRSWRSCRPISLSTTCLPRRDGGEAATAAVSRAVEFSDAPSLHACVLAVSLERRVRRMVAACYMRLRRHIALDTETRRVLETLRQANLSIGVVTNGSPQKRHTIHLLGLDRMTSCIFISAGFGHRKPDGAIFRAAASCVGVHPARVLVVGDRRCDDIWGAHAVGMTTAWLRLGHRRPLPRAVPGADVTIDVLDELIAALGLAPPSSSSCTSENQLAPAGEQPTRQLVARESGEGAARHGR